MPEGIDLKTCTDPHLDNPTRQFRGKTIASWTEAKALCNPAPESAKELLYKTRNTRSVSHEIFQGLSRSNLLFIPLQLAICLALRDSALFRHFLQSGFFIQLFLDHDLGNSLLKAFASWALPLCRVRLPDQ